MSGDNPVTSKIPLDLGGCSQQSDDTPVRPHRRASAEDNPSVGFGGRGNPPDDDNSGGGSGGFERAALASCGRAFEASTPGSACAARGERRRLSGRGHFRAGQVRRFAGGSAGAAASLLEVAPGPGTGSPVTGCTPRFRFAGARARRQPQGAGSPGSVAIRVSPTHEGPGNRRRVDG